MNAAMPSEDLDSSPPANTPEPGSPVPLQPDFESIIESVRGLQADLHYQQAQDALRHLVTQLDLTPEERRGVEGELQGLQNLLRKIDGQEVHIAAFGLVGRGKSSLLNALVGQPVFEAGPLHGVTQQVQAVDWHLSPEAIAGSDRPLMRASVAGTDGSQVVLVDTPGLDEVAGEQREAMARQLAEQADLILFVVSGDISRVEYAALSALRQASKPMLLVFNKVDQYPEADRQAIYETIRDQRVRALLSPEEIVMTAAAPLARVVVQQADGTRRPHVQRGTPDVDALKLKIWEVLQREGKSLVALNSMLFANAVQGKLIQQKLVLRDRQANQTIWNGVMTKAVAIALNPILVADMVSGAVIDVAMILALSRLYGIAMTQRGAAGLLQTIALGVGGVSLSELLVTLGLGSLKSLLGAAAPATGGVSLAPYLSVALTQGAIAGVSTYAIGQVAKVYLANGASWGPDSPKTVVTAILDTLDETSILHRIKDELRTKLDQHHRPVSEPSLETSHEPEP